MSARTHSIAVGGRRCDFNDPSFAIHRYPYGHRFMMTRMRGCLLQRWEDFGRRTPAVSLETQWERGLPSPNVIQADACVNEVDYGNELAYSGLGVTSGGTTVIWIGMGDAAGSGTGPSELPPEGY
jgi:hypothetical protein